MTLAQMAKAEESDGFEQRACIQDYFPAVLFVTIIVGFFVHNAINAVMKTQHDKEQEGEEEEIHPMEVDQDEEFMEVDQTDMSHDDEENTTGNETRQLHLLKSKHRS